MGSFFSLMFLPGSASSEPEPRRNEEKVEKPDKEECSSGDVSIDIPDV